MHLDFAERIRTHSRLDDATRSLITQELPAFYLGNVAADYQTICDIPREKTHFYDVPPTPEHQAHQVMLACYPELAQAARLPAGQAVFVAGYCFHLIQDLVWYWQVLMPYFLQAEGWPAEARVRFVSHNTLLTYLDQEARRALPATAGTTLAAAESHHWLPFAADADVHRWRDLLARQLLPGGTSQTILIYARRLGMTPAGFAANLQNPTWMHEQVFHRAPLAQVQAALDEGIDQAASFVADSLAALAHRQP